MVSMLYGFYVQRGTECTLQTLLFSLQHRA